MQRAEKMGVREKIIFVAGGPRVTHPMALECGLDAGFSVGTKPSDVASYIVEEYLRRNPSLEKINRLQNDEKCESRGKKGDQK